MGTDSVSKHIVSSFRHFLQILQNLEFTYTQNSYSDHRNFDSVRAGLSFKGFVYEMFEGTDSVFNA
jgi:hypothetical protein